jgi:hypothetical protein
MSTLTDDRPHRYDRTGERIDTDPTPWDLHPEPKPDRARCTYGQPIAADGTCCLWHDTHPTIRRTA